MSRSVRISLFLFLSFLIMAIPAFQVNAIDEHATNIAKGLKSFVLTLDGMGVSETLEGAIPLTAVNPTELLSLNDLFSQTLGTAIGGLTPDDVPDYATIADLINTIETADTTYNDVTISFDNVQIGINGGNNDLIDVTFDVVASRAVSVPVTMLLPEVALLEGGDLPLNLSLDATFNFQFDTLEGVPVMAFYMTDEPTIHVHTDTTTTLAPFAAQLGLADIDVSGTANLNVDANITFQNPDSGVDSIITRDEWQTTALIDLLNIAFVDEPGNAIDATLNLEAKTVEGGELIPGSPDATVTLLDADLTNGIDDPTIQLNALGGFANLSRDDMLTGVAQLATSLVSAQTIGDLPIPFLRQNLSDIFFFAQPLVDFVAQQGATDIICGTQPGTTELPPSGSLLGLTAGTAVYCRAYTFENPATVDWDILSGTVDGNETNIATVGTNPTTNVTFTLGIDGRPQISLTLNNGGDSEDETFVPRFNTVQEMFTYFENLGGFPLDANDINYDPATTALTFRLQKTITANALPDATLDFGDQLKEGSNLSGLLPTATAGASVTPQDIALDVTFGILLADGLVTDERFFLQVTDGEHEFEAGVSATANVELSGRLGFVEVTASGDGGQNPDPDSTEAFALGPADKNAPMLAVDIAAPGITISPTNPTAVANAIRLSTLLDDPGGHLTAVCNVALSSGLMVKANLSGVAVPVTGGVGVRWPNVFTPNSCLPDTGQLAITPTIEFANQLQGLDITPSIFGTSTSAIQDNFTLTDSNADFLNLDRDLVGVRLRNIGDGSSCVITDVTAATLTCESGLQGGTFNYWSLDDKYEVAGNPIAMLNVILDNLDAIVSQVDDLTGGEVGAVLDAQLPLVNVSPNDLIAQYQNLQTAIDEIRTGESDATIQCGPVPHQVIGGYFDVDDDGSITASDDGTIQGVQIIDGVAQEGTIAGIRILNGRADINNDDLGDDNDDASAPAGDPFTVPPGAQLYCQAKYDGEPDSVEWDVVGGDSVPTGNQTNTDTVGSNPTAFAEFTVDYTPGKQSFNYRIMLKFADADGDHSGALPSFAPPPTLKSLEELLEAKLGLPPQALEFDLVDLPAAGGNSPDGTTDLVMRLGYGICTSNNTTISACDPQGDVQIDKLDVPINLDLGASVPGLVGFKDDPSFAIEFAARASFDIGVSLEAIPEVVVLDTSGIILEAGATLDDVDFEASVGPVALLLGDNAGIAGTHTDAMTSTTTLTDDNAAFDDAGITVGDIVLNETDGSSCEVTAVSPTTLTCDDELDGGTDNTWEQNDAYNIGGNGVVKISAGFSLTPTLPSETATLGDFIDSLDASLYSVTPNTTPPCSGDVCAALSMGVEIGNELLYMGDLAFSQDLDGSPPTVSGIERLEDRIASAVLDWSLLFKALPEILEDVENTLSGAAGDVSVPLVGDALDAGADVAGVLREEVVKPINENVLPLIEEIENTVSNAGELEDVIEQHLLELLDPDLLAQPDFSKTNGLPAEAMPPTIIVTTYCDTDPLQECADGDGLLDIVDVRITFSIEEPIVETDPSFDIGIPGIPLRSAGTLHAEVNWSLLLDFGLSKDEGPYLVAHDARNDAPADHGIDLNELEVGAEVGIGEATQELQDQCNDNDPLAADQQPPNNDTLPDYSATHCIFGEIAFLQVHMRDRQDSAEGEHSNLSLTAGLNITKDTPDDVAYITFQDLIGSSTVGLEFNLTADAHIDVRLRTGLNADVIPGFPSVLGTFALDWDRTISTGSEAGFQETVDTPLTIKFDNLYLDAGAFVSQFLAPVAESVQNITSPLMPVIDTVSAPLPILSDLSRMTGGEDISLMSLMEDASGADLTLVRRVIEFVRFANSIDTSNTGTVWIGLGDLLPGFAETGGGSFELDAAKVLEGPPTSGKQRQLIKLDTVDVTSSSDLQTGLTTGSSPAPEGTFGVNGLTFPFIQEPMQIFGLLMGEDATLIRYDAGTVRATASVGYTFRFAVGPIPMSVSIIGSATLEGRFAMGYDTYGIRQVINGESPANLFNGIFIDDLDVNGNDVPEITLKGTVAARAAVDLVIISAGVEGGIELTVALNLDDRPDPDGKLRLDEIVNKLSNPICLFEVSGKLEAFFAAFVKIDFFLFSKEFRFELARVTLLEFSAACEPPQPKLASISDSGGKKVLTLLLGSEARRQERGIAVEEDNEEFTVRMMENGRISVSAFGVFQTFCCHFDRVEAHGDSGDDIISIEAGATIPAGQTEAVPIPFTVPVHLWGGAGNDQLRGADGDDHIWGGADNDQINGGGGNDILEGEGGNDAIDGGLGNDLILGGDDNDRLNGSSGADHLEGGNGDDQMNGGPGTAEPGEDTPESQDLADSLIGGAGSDALAGGYDDDILFGDNAVGWTDTNADGRLTLNELNLQTACDENSSDGNQVGDQIKGDDDNDYLFGGVGQDEITGAGGDDYICGNGDDDTLYGDGDATTSPGDDDIFGGNGHDTLLGDDGHDWLDGQNGNDVLHGGNDADDMLGGNGRDELHGDSHNDIMLGDNGSIANHPASAHNGSVASVVALVTPGNAAATGPEIEDCTGLGTDNGNADCIFGSTGNDFIFGEGGHDHLFGENNDDYMEGNAGDDMMRGGQQDDLMHGNDGEDEMYGDSGDDEMYGDADSDTMRGNAGEDLMHGNGAGDIMHGDADNDEMYGNAGEDEMYGDAHDDYMEGNEDHDTMYGGKNQDDMIGGSSDSSADDTNDDMDGNEDHDVMIGDNGTITRPGGSNPPDGAVLRDVVLYNLNFGNSNTNLAGPDTMNGNGGNDHMYGQGEDDIMHGNDGDDYMEGNGGDDTMHGDAQQDDLIGGTSQEMGDSPDGSDTIYGDDDYDVILGDNALIERPIVNGQWVINSFNDAVTRNYTLYDVATTMSSPPAVSSGGDLLFGGAEDDLLYGQGNADDVDDDNDGLINEDPVDGLDNDGDGSTDEDAGGDYMHGNDGEDYMEGNAGSDWLFGDAGNDDMVGGTGRINGDPATGTNGRLDKGDWMYGGTGYDVMAGDNALLVRTLVNGEWQSNTYNDGIQHEHRILLDIDSPDTAVVSGPDTMYGNENDDLMYGQGDDDTMFGNEGDDFMEGNAHSDTMYGNEDQDDMIGGTVTEGLTDEGDFMYGGGAGDVMLGDNGTIERPLDGNGQWQYEPNTNDEIRDIHLFDVETVDDAADPAASGSDLMYGDEGRDYMFGQGNDAIDDDGDGRFNEDPNDGVDNDRDGRESNQSDSFDCLDGQDNDEDGLMDGADPDCAAAIDEDDGGDEMHGGTGDDYMEGNHGSDEMYGDEDEDDMIGGNTAGDGHIFGGVLPTNLTDGDDTMHGGAEDDQMIGDNGSILRPTDNDGYWLYLDGYGYNIAVRVVAMDEIPEDEGAFGHDYMRGNDGHDEMYGQLGADYMEGNNDEDAMLGDLGIITTNIEDGSREEIIAIPAPFLEDTIYPEGSLYRLVDLYAFENGDDAEWNDIMLGGNGNDSMHGGAGDDLANGNADEDHIFGGDGNDALWGGPGHDHLYGGHDDDWLDVKPRPADAPGPGLAGNSSLTMFGPPDPPPGPPGPPNPADPPEWFTYAGVDNYQDIDTIYGGWGQDAMQADVGGPGPQPGDRLVDWVGAYNVYYTCPAAYGEGVITRILSPQMIAYLQQLSQADGALDTMTDGSSGFRELAMVFAHQAGQNSHPPHPDHPGHFTCN